MRYTLSIAELGRLLARDVETLGPLLSAAGEPAVSASGRLSPSSVRRVLERAGRSFRFRVVAIVNLKGGVGKTTSAATIASRAVQYGHRTCLLDLDPQASATLLLGVTPPEDAAVFRDVWAAPAERVPGALHEIQEFFALLPSALENSLLDVSLVNPASQKRAVAGVCEVLRTLGFDLVIVDCAPSLGAGSISAACAADVIVIPAGNDAFSSRGIALTCEEVAAIRETFGLPPVPIRLLSTMVDGRETLSARYVEALAQRHRERLLPGVIHRSTEFSKALERRETVFASTRKSGPKHDYDRVTRALLELGGEETEPPRARALATASRR